MHWLTWIGVFFIGLGTVFTMIGQQKVSDKSNQLLQDKSDKITDLSQENVRLSSELNKINQKIAATVTGGDSFCYLYAKPSSTKFKTFDFYIYHKGNYPLYDVSIRLINQNCINHFAYNQIIDTSIDEKKIPKTADEIYEMYSDPEFIKRGRQQHKALKDHMRDCTIQETIGTINKSQDNDTFDSPFFSFTMPENIDPINFSQSYIVTIYSRNGTISQNININMLDGKVKLKSTIQKELPKKKTLELHKYGFIVNSW